MTDLLIGKIPPKITELRRRLVQFRKANKLTFTTTHLNPIYKGQPVTKFHTYLILTGTDAQNAKVLQFCREELGIRPNIQEGNFFRTSFALREFYVNTEEQE